MNHEGQKEHKASLIKLQRINNFVFFVFFVVLIRIQSCK
jgi:hypothetical protein